MTVDAARPITWQDAARWGVVVATLASSMFWLSHIDAAIANVQQDVIEIKVGLREHVKLPAHPVGEVRLRAVERKVK